MAVSDRNADAHPGAVSLGYVGIDYAVCDCWGVVRLVLHEQAGIDLPAYDDIAASDLAAIARGRDVPVTWLPVDRDSVKPLDVVLMRGRPFHCGIMMDSGRLLHIEEATMSVEVPLDHFRVRHRIVGFYRHRQLMP